MGFVNLMGNDVWSPADIDARVAALIRSRYSADDELKAARLARKAEPDADDLAYVQAVDTWIAACVAEGRQARDDVALLVQVLRMEDANRRLDRPAVEPERDEDGNITNADALAEDAVERAEAQAIIDGASPEAKALFDLRNPPELEEGAEE